MPPGQVAGDDDQPVNKSLSTSVAAVTLCCVWLCVLVTHVSACSCKEWHDQAVALGAQVAVVFDGQTQQLEVTSLLLFDNMLGLRLPMSCPADSPQLVSLAAGAGVPSMTVRGKQRSLHACYSVAMLQLCPSHVPDLPEQPTSRGL